MQWQEVSPGRYERPFDSLERFYRVIADAGLPLNKQHYLITSTLQFRILPPADQIQKTWRALRRQYPQIAAVADETGSNFCYTVPSPKELDAWVEDSFTIDQSGRSANEIQENEPPSSIFRLFYLPQTRELVFRTPHWRIDGIGLMHLQTAFLHILSMGPPAEICLDGSEAKSLTPSLDDAVAAPLTATQAPSKAVSEELNVFLEGLPAISIPTLPNALPSTPRHIMSSFTEEVTRKVIAACKARGLTVTTAVNAALVITTLPYAQHDFDAATRGQGGGKYTGFNAIDLRKYLPAPLNGPEAAVSIYHTGIPFSLDLGVHRDFDSISSEIQKNYKRDLKKDEPRNLFEFLPEYVNQVLTLHSAQPADPLRAPAHPELSSIGIVNEHVPTRYEGPDLTIEVENWWIAVEVINRLLLTNVWTWKDQLQLSVNWNHAFYDDDFVYRFLEEWKITILKELGVN